VEKDGLMNALTKKGAEGESFKGDKGGKKLKIQ